MSSKFIKVKNKTKINKDNFSHQVVFVVEYDGVLLEILAKVTNKGFVKFEWDHFQGKKKIVLRTMLENYKEPSILVPPV